MDAQPADDLLDGGWFTTEELARMLGVDPSTLRRWRTARPGKDRHSFACPRESPCTAPVMCGAGSRPAGLIPDRPPDERGTVAGGCVLFG
jgi:hypothetical protein